MHSSIKGHLLGWHGSFVGKKQKKKRVKGCSLIFDMDPLEGEKQNGI